MKVLADRLNFSQKNAAKKKYPLCCCYIDQCLCVQLEFPMDTAWRFRLVLILTFAIIIFGDMLGYANVKGDKNSNQRNVDTTQKKKNPNQNHHQQNIEGMFCLLYTYTFADDRPPAYDVRIL